MITVLLWITLTASTILLIAAASPVRLSCKAVYSEDRRNTEISAMTHYIHPQVLRAEYSAEDKRFRFFILGFEKKGGKGDQEGINTGDINTDGINADGISTDGINADSINIKDIRSNGINTGGINTKGINTDGINTNSTNISTNGINTDGVNTDSINTENINTDDADAKDKKSSLLSRIKSKINNIKRRRLYKVIRNKPLREKLLRWLKRSSIRAIRTVSIEKLKLHARIGLHDPAALGKFYSYFSAAQSALTPRRYYNIDLSMKPVFTEKCLDIDSEIKLKTTPSIILWHLIIIAATFPYFRVRKVIRNQKGTHP